MGGQLARYRTVGAGAELIDWGARRRVIRIAAAVPDTLVAEVVGIERACCPFFEIDWDPGTRRLSFAVATSDHEPALDAISHALALTPS